MGQYRIFYDVILEESTVSTLAVGFKKGNTLYVRGFANGEAFILTLIAADDEESIRTRNNAALMALLDERRRKLAAEGLFDEERKRTLPFLPRVIGVVTSPTGAVIRDILHRLADRFPRRVLVWPARVQGEGSAEEVAAATCWPWTRRSTVRGVVTVATLGDAVAVFMPLL